MFRSMSLLIMGYIVFHLSSIVTFAQASFQGIGFLTGATSSLALDVSPDGEYVVGISGGGLPFIWSATTGMQAMSEQIGIATGVSAFGNAACGTLRSSPEQAFYWTTSGGVILLGSLPGGSISQSFDISDDGQVVTGTGNSTAGSQGFIWTAGGGMTGLGDLPGGNFFSSAEGISGDGMVVVGWSRSVDNFGEAFRWTLGGGMTGLGSLSGFTSSHAYAASFDGSVIVGFCTMNTDNGQIIEATRWSGSSISSLGRLPGGTHSRAYGVSNDGQVVVGQAGTSTAQVAFIWDAVNGIRDLKDALEFEYGLNLSGWNLTLANGISSDGKVIVGYGTNPSGQGEAWRAVLPPQQQITVISPITNEILIADTQHDILWASDTSIVSLLIEFSDDDGTTYSIVATDVPADSNIYAWTVPKALSTRCRIKISNVNNSDVFAESNLFKVKGYQLTRFTTDGNYEAFKPDVDGWSFANTDTNMWPATWWEQFNYQSGIDPYTNQPYPDEEPFLSAQPSDFPDWPLFVRVYGESRCYWADSRGIYQEQSKTKWNNIKTPTREGSCAGFAISSLIAFDDDQAF